MAKFYHETVALYGREAAAGLYRLTAAEIARQDGDLPGVFKLNGSLRIAADEAEKEDCRRHLAALRADGFPAEPYSGPEGEGLLLPQDGTFHPLARVRRMAGRLRARGLRLYERSPVAGLQPGLVRTDAGLVRCAAVIVAVDGRLEQILPELAGRVRTARLQMLATAPAPEVSYPRAVYRRDGFEYWQQRPDGCIAFGGFRDHALEEEWTESAEPTARIQGLLEHYLRQEMKVRAPITHRWAASVGYTPDGLPILEEVRPGIWALGGYNGTGNIVGALCGRAAARLATGRDSAWSKTLAAARAHRA
jgi:gamma-glutamylputrescine oxidase